MRKCVLAIVVMIAGPSCRDSVNLPPVKGPPLAVPQGDGETIPASEPLKVVFKTPKGKTRSPHLQISATFNKPMVPLAMVEKRAEQAPFSIEPAVDGKQRWLSSRTVALVSERPLAGSTRYRVTLKPAAAIDGSKLGEPVSWSFETPRLKVLANDLSWRHRRYAPPDVSVKIRLNQRIDSRSAARYLSFTASKASGESVTIAARATHAPRYNRGPNDPTVLRIRPVAPLPLDSTIKLQLAKGLVGLEGPLPMETPYTLTFKTYGPFRVKRLSCSSGCDPRQPPTIEFSTPVRRDLARAAIRVNGKRLSKSNSSWSSDTLYLSNLKLDAQKTYRIAFDRGLTDSFGQKLQQPQAVTFKTGDYPPYMHLPVGSGVIEAKGPNALPVAFLNVDRAWLRHKRLSAAELSKALADGRLDQQDKPFLAGFGAQQRVVALTRRRNKRQLVRFPLAKMLAAGRSGLQGRGVLGLELQAEYKADDKKRTVYRRAFLRVSDLGITAKYGPSRSLIWVTRLSSGLPVKGANISIWRIGETSPSWQGQTDEHGLALAPGASDLGKDKKRDYLFFVAYQGDENYALSTTQSGLRAWDYNLEETWEDGRSDLLGMMFTERGIYRPGEKVQVKGVLRRPGASGLLLPSGDCTVVVYDARGEVVATQTVPLSEFGSFHLPVKLPFAAPLGRYRLVAWLESPHGKAARAQGSPPKAAGRPTVTADFRVEEYRAAEFAVTVTPEKRQLVRGDRLRFANSGRYLFGAPMRRAKFNTYISWAREIYAPPGHPGYTFHNEISWWGVYRSSSGSLGNIRGKLDENGASRDDRLLSPAKMDGPRRYTIETTVTDLSRQSISNRSSVLLHPGTIYIGAKAKETFLSAGKQLATDIIAAERSGKLRAGVTVTGTLYERTWQQIRKKGYGGRHYFVSRPLETKVGSCRVQTAKAPVPCTITLPKAGYYVLRLAASDERSNPIQASFGAYATGPDYVPWRRDDEHKVEIITDRKRYKVGQTARLLIKSPFTHARALLTVERNGIYIRRPLTITKTASWVNIPITQQLLPNAFVSLVMVRGRVAASSKPKSGEEDPGRPLVKMGYAKLAIDRIARRLKVDVKPLKKTYRPGQEVVVDLRARDSKGRGVKAELTVFAADEGVLSLAGYRTPDPMSVFYAQRGLSIRTSDNRVVLLSRRVFGPKGGNPGGGGGAGRGESGGDVRKRFITSPYFNPSVLTDDAGRAQVKFKLPDNLTTYRLMAVAVGGAEYFGSGDSQVVVNKPLLMLPTLPRYVRVSDTIEAGVVIHNHSGKNGSIRVKVEATGITVNGPTFQTLAIRTGAGGEARFRFKASAAGTARFTFRARLDDFEDALQLSRPIKLPLVKEVVATHGATSSAAAEGLLPTGDLRPEVGGLEVSMSSSALVGLKASFEYLMDYPYECTEQTTSRLIPLAVLKQLTTAYGLKKPEQLPKLVSKLVARLQKTQRWNGGFSLWSSSSAVSAWLSAYASWGLHLSAQQGAPVSKTVLKNAVRYLEGQLGQKLGGYQPLGLGLATRAFIVHVLAEMGCKPSASINRLYERRDKLPIFARALLLSAMAKVDADKKAQQTLLDDILNQVHQTGKIAKVEEDLGYDFATIFHTSTRSTAMVLDALLRIQPDHPLVDKLVAYLVSRQKNGRWRNTQETAYALLGLQRYYRAREQESPDFTARVLLGDQELLKKPFKGRSVKVYSRKLAMASLVGKRGVLGFVVDGTGRLHYSAKLRYVRAKLPQKPWDEGFFVTRSYEPLRNAASSFAALRGAQPAFNRADVKAGKVALVAGDMVRVKLRIVVPQHMHYVVVDDPLPAGLEAVNFNLMTAARHTRAYTSSRYGARHGGGSWWATPFYHRETRDDRVMLFADELLPGVYTYVYLARATTMGTFVAPPTKVEQMYEPETFGRTATSYVEVEGK